jgi:glycine cleavage system H protein
MTEIYFTKDHEWIRVEGEIGTIGVTDHAQRALGDVVFVELPQREDVLSKGDEAAVVESVKAASDVFSPVTGTVVAVNQLIVDQPGLINEQAEDEAWFFKVRLADPSELDGLMDRADYDDYVAGQE